MKKLVFIIILTLAFDSSQAFFNSHKKGNSFMDGQLVPVELKVEHGITAAASLKYNNKFACLNGSAEFALASLDDKLKASVDVIRGNVPGIDYNGVFGADETGKFMWCKSGWREAIIIDTESKKVIQKMASYNGNSYIGTFIPVIAKEKFVYVWVKVAEGPLSLPVFDFSQDDPVAVIDKFRFCIFLPNPDGHCLIASYSQDKSVTWINAVLAKTDIASYPEDSLTKELTKKQVKYDAFERAYNLSKGILIGPVKVDKWMKPFSVRWNPDKTDIKIEPLILQCPKPDIFEEKWEFSLDGNWCMNKVIRNWNTKTEYRAIAFYKVDNAFPNGLSTPIYGGLTSEDNKGCFINHDALGPLYLDIPPSGDPVVYKLNQIPELLKNAVKK